MAKVDLKTLDVLLSTLAVAARLIENIPVCGDFQYDKRIAITAIRRVCEKLEKDFFEN